MRLIFFLFSAALIMGWYGWAIRPVKREQSNLLFMVSGIMLVLLIAGFLRWV
jgi:hypothetical protein